LDPPSLEERVLRDVFGRSGKIKSDFGATASAWRKHFIPDTGDVVAIHVAGGVNDSVNAGFGNSFSWLILGPHLEKRAFNS
jgi:hypothetical protein